MKLFPKSQSINPMCWYVTQLTNSDKRLMDSSPLLCGHLKKQSRSTKWQSLSCRILSYTRFHKDCKSREVRMLLWSILLKRFRLYWTAELRHKRKFGWKVKRADIELRCYHWGSLDANHLHPPDSSKSLPTSRPTERSFRS